MRRARPTTENQNRTGMREPKRTFVGLLVLVMLPDARPGGTSKKPRSRGCRSHRMPG
jgi:hypothetical protein